jgi:hypothetical protein
LLAGSNGLAATEVGDGAFFLEARLSPDSSRSAEYLDEEGGFFRDETFCDRLLLPRGFDEPHFLSMVRRESPKSNDFVNRKINPQNETSGAPVVFVLFHQNSNL